MNILEGLDVYHFKDYFVLHDSGSNPFLYKIRESRYEQNNMRYQILKQMNVQYLEFFILVSHFELCISRLLYIVQKCFRTPDRAIDPTFQMKYVPDFYYFCNPIIQTILSPFYFGKPGIVLLIFQLPYVVQKWV